ncbi:DNA repair protein RecN [Blautia sp. OF03-15BH]|uniref:DNA repair protein RecN n=1 Tax=Blautia sp. OF03-15BH TaxID=2292287 RepID=UPI000E52C03B|nr:DNA repair protein RecN [Blautia sp. OF03-15BH]RGX99859.1 DNA repair protein RecN [Blautia sp. OF03-15BH]
MLLNIHVKNMALIDEADIDLTEGLNILTGETGAGKSIIIGSVNVALGLAGFKGFAREDAAFALAELVFSVDNEKQRKALEKLDLSLEDDQIIISRRLVNGRSVSKVNGETVPVSLVRQVSEILIDIHGQHEHQALLHQKNHLAILDAFAGEVLSGPAGEVRTLYREYDALDKKLKETDLSETARAKEMDFLAFEVGEIEDAAVKPGEDEALEQAYRRQVNSQRIMEGVTEAETLTGSDFGGAAELVSRAYRSLSTASAYDEKLESITAELADIDNLLNDFHRELKDYQESISFDAESFQQTEDRLNLLNHLKAKYGGSIDKVLSYKKEKEERLEELAHYEAYRQRLKKELEQKKTELLKACGKVSEIRKQAAELLAGKITAVLQDLNFLDVQFSIDFQETAPGPEGFDEICFLISMNPGQPLQPLQKVASGGELSRVMLAIKTVLADKDAVGTMIFDEIDVGISGRTAQKVSEKMAVIARSRQVICITHLAQIASMADTHFCIEKKLVGQEAKTFIRRLSDEESIEELARILGGAEITKTVRQSAREMKELAVCTKKY